MTSLKILVLPILLLCTLLPPDTNAQEYEVIELGDPVSILGSPEKQAELFQPWDFVGGNGDTIYVLDYGDRKVHVFNYSGDLLHSFGREGQGPGEFLAPRMLAFTSDHVIVGDTRSLRLEVFSSSGKYIKSIRLESIPRDIVGHDGNVYVSSMWQSGAPVSRISIENPDDNALLLTDAEQLTQIIEGNNRFVESFKVARIYLSVIDDHLIASFGGNGAIATIPIDANNTDPSWVLLDHELLDEYKRRFRGIVTKNKEERTYVPNVFYGSASIWSSNILGCELRTYEQNKYEGIVCFLFDLSTGQVIGEVRSDIEGLNSFQRVSNGVYASLDYGNARVLLFRPDQ